MEFQAFWAEMWARCGPEHMGFEQREAAREVYEKAKAKIEAEERELEALRKDAERYRWLRDAPCADVRIVGRGKRSGAELDATVDECIGAV